MSQRTFIGLDVAVLKNGSIQYAPFLVVIAATIFFSHVYILAPIGVSILHTFLAVAAVIATFIILKRYDWNEAATISGLLTVTLAVLTAIDSFFTFNGAKETGKTVEISILISVAGFFLFFLSYTVLARFVHRARGFFSVLVFVVIWLLTAAAQYVMSIQFNLEASTGDRPYLQALRPQVNELIVPYVTTAESRVSKTENIIPLFEDETSAWLRLADEEREGKFTGRRGEGPATKQLLSNATEVDIQIQTLKGTIAEHRASIDRAIDQQRELIVAIDDRGLTYSDATNRINFIIREASKSLTFDVTRAASLLDTIKENTSIYFDNIISRANEEGRSLLVIRQQEAGSRHVRMAKIIDSLGAEDKPKEPVTNDIDKFNEIWGNWREYLNDIGFAFTLSWSAGLVILLGLLIHWHEPARPPEYLSEPADAVDAGQKS